MALFSFNYQRKPLNEFTLRKDDPKESFPKTSEAMTSSTDQSVIALNGSENCVQTTPETTSMTNRMTTDSTLPEICNDTEDLKQRVAEELEKIENWNALNEMETKRRLDEIKNLKKTVEELKQKVTQIESENKGLKVRLNSEDAERDELILKMENTREMMVRVKDCFRQIEKRFEALQELKTVINLVNTNRCNNFEDLAKQFYGLEMRHKHIVSNLESDLSIKSHKIHDLVKGFEKMKLEFGVNESEAINQISGLKSELIECKQRLNTTDLDLKSANDENKELNRKLIDCIEKYESMVKTDQQKDNDLESLQNMIENQRRELTDQIESLIAKEVENEKQMNALIADKKAKEEESFELKTQIELKEKTIHDLQIDIESKAKEISDSKAEISAKEKQLTDFETQKSDWIRLSDEMNSRIFSIELEKQEFEKSLENEKKTTISDFENTINELEASLECLRKESKELSELNEQNQSLIDVLESKANQTVVEKEEIEHKLQNDLKELKEGFENKMKEFFDKINEFELRIEELNALKAQNETTICEMVSEAEALKSEKQSLEIKLEREERSLEKQITNMNQILESCKTDYNKRVEDKEDRIREYKKETERMRLSVEHLTKKCERLESEKSFTNRKLQELTISAMRSSNNCSPNRVLTPKFMSPMESTRIGDRRTSSPLAQPLSRLSNPQFESSFTGDVVLSATQELSEKFKNKSQQKVTESGKQLEAKGKKIVNLSKGKDRKTNVELEDNSEGSVYQLIDDKLKRIRKTNRNESKQRIEIPLKVNMSLTEDFNKSKEQIDGIESEENREPIHKKAKTKFLNLKTNGKNNVRFDNIMKGRPTPTKTDDLSWLGF